MDTIRFMTMRLLYGLILVLGVVVVNFLLIHLAPGDPAEVIAGEMGGATEDIMSRIRDDYGLDEPVLTQLGIYLGNAVMLDLGTSHFFNAPVTQLIGARIGPTILLVLSAQLLSIVIGTIMGVLAARKPRGPFSAFVSVCSLFGYALPVFWTGIMLIILFASIIPIFPVEGYVSARFEGGPVVYVFDVLHHLALPALTLSTIFLAQYARISRASMIEVLGADYVRTARAKGVGEMKVVFWHALRNAVLPLLTVAGLQFGNLFSGALLIETVFNWPGMGTLAYESILRRDYPTVMGVLIIAAAMVVAANILTDIGYRLADPRVRSGGRA